MQPWKRIEPTKVTKVGWRTITSKTFVMNNGEEVVFDTFHPDGQEFISVLPFTKDGKIVALENFQYGPEKVMVDLPGGFVDKDETPLQTTERELLEETGYRAGKIEYLGPFHKDAYMNSVWHAFVAYDCVQERAQELEVEEELDVKLISAQELIDNAKNDLMNDHAVVIMAYDVLQKAMKGETL